MDALRSMLALSGLLISSTVAAVDDFTAGESGMQELYGTWDLFEVKGNGMSARVRLTLEKGNVVNSSSCSYEDKSVHVQASSAARITDDEIMILEDSEAQGEYEPGFLNCKVSLDKGTIRYQLVDDNLVLHMVGHDEIVELSRSGGDFMQARRLAGASIQTP